MARQYIINILDISEQQKFNSRMNLEGSLGFILHSFLINLLDVIGERNDNAYGPDMHQIATLRETRECKRYYVVSEDIFYVVRDFTWKIPSSAKEFQDLFFQNGSNLLVSQLREDVIGQASK